MCKRALCHLTEVFCILFGQSKLRSPGISAGLALNLLLIFLLIFHLHKNNTDFTSITHMQLAFTCTHLDTYFAGHLACFFGHLVSRSEVGRKTAFASLLFIALSVDILFSLKEMQNLHIWRVFRQIQRIFKILLHH